MEEDRVIVNPRKDLLSQDLIVIEPIQINKIRVRRKGQVLIGAGVGLAVGAAVGGLLVQEENSRSSWGGIPEVDAIAVGSTAAIGTGLGALAGSGRRSYDINGSLETYAGQLPLLQKYSYLIE